jgi:hypothetical protein
MRDDGKPLPERLPVCTLVVQLGHMFERDETRTAARRLLERCESVEALYVTYEVQAYRLSGAPDGALREFYARTPGMGESEVARRLGRLQADRIWRADALAAGLSTAGRVLPFNRLGRDLFGARLEAERQSLGLDLGNAAAVGPVAVMIGGQLVGDAATAGLQIELNGQPDWIARMDIGEFAIGGFLPAGTERIDATLEIVDGPIGAGRSGDFVLNTPGIYLLWVAIAPLEEDAFRDGVHAGDFYNFGALGDEVFLRGAINESEGTPSNNGRWTRGDVAFDVVVAPGSAPREVVVHGMLAEAIADRRVRARVRGGGGDGGDLEVEREIGGSGWDAHVFELPSAIAPGIHRVEIETGGYWIPAETQPGGDPRRLGWLVDGVELR